MASSGSHEERKEKAQVSFHSCGAQCRRDGARLCARFAEVEKKLRLDVFSGDGGGSRTSLTGIKDPVSLLLSIKTQLEFYFSPEKIECDEWMDEWMDGQVPGSAFAIHAFLTDAHCQCGLAAR